MSNPICVPHLTSFGSRSALLLRPTKKRMRKVSEKRREKGRHNTKRPSQKKGAEQTTAYELVPKPDSQGAALGLELEDDDEGDSKYPPGGDYEGLGS